MLATNRCRKNGSGHAVAKDAVIGNDLHLLSDSAVLNFGADKDISLTHTADTGLTLACAHANGTNLKINNTATDGDTRVEFQLSGTTVWSVGCSDGDSDMFVIEDGAGALGADPAFQITADKSAKFFGTLEATTSFTIGNAAMSEADLEQLDGITAGTAAASKAVVLDGSKNIATIGTIGCGAITSTGNSSMAQLTTSGRIIVDDTTEATSTTDGSLQTDGGLSVAKDAVIGDDLKLLSDSAVLSLGAGSDATLTHDGTTGLTIAATPITINSTGDLTLDSTTDIVLDADGGDIFFKDNGTTFGSATNTSGNLIIKSGTTTAATFSGDATGLTGVPSISVSSITAAGNILPSVHSTYNLGSNAVRWNNIYTMDMHFSNKGSTGNDVDGTWGDWTLQEGDENIFMKNNRTGKKYKINLTEV